MPENINMSFSIDHIISLIDNNRPKPRSCIFYAFLSRDDDNPQAESISPDLQRGLTGVYDTQHSTQNRTC